MRLNDDITRAMQEAREWGTSDAFMRSATVLSTIKSDIREELQTLTSRHTVKIIDKLEDHQELTPDEIGILRVWITGDAQSYLKKENNFRDWLEELNRLESVIRDYENKDIGENDLFDLYGIVQDAIRVAADVSYYLENKERIERFEKAISTLENAKADHLIRILRAKYGSPDL